MMRFTSKSSVIVILIFVLATGSCWSQQSHKTVLILHSYHKAEWTDSLLDGINSVLGKIEDLDLVIEYMDTKRIDSEDYYQALDKIYKMKYGDTLFDVLLTSDDNAYRFALARQDGLFKQAPIVFCGVNRFDQREIKDKPFVTGVVEKGDFQDTLAFATRVCKDADAVHVILDHTSTAKMNKEEFLQVLKHQHKDIEVDLLIDISLSDLANRLATLPPKDFAFFISFWEDSTGQLVSPENLSAAFYKSSVPVFGRSEWMMNKGMTGGKCVSGFHQGQAAAQLAERILDGENPATIPINKNSPNRFMYDYKLLERYGIDPSVLPPDSILFNKPPPTFYEMHYQLIWLLTTVLIALTALVLSLSLNISKRRKTEKALREGEEKYRQIFENILDIYYEAALDGTILEVSPSIERYSQYKREELIGKSVYDIYTDPSDRDKLVEAIISKGSLRDYEINFTDKDGTKYICSLNIELIKDSKGTPIKIVGIFRDSSDRKKNEEERIKAQQIAAEHEKYSLVGQIAGKMAHDFNNILAAIMGNSELALLDCTDTETRKRLDLIHNQTIRGKNLTKNLVAFAKDQEPKQEYFRVNDKIELVLNLLQRELEEIDVIREYGFKLPDILADPGMIEHALVNLVQNSIHATSLIEQPKIVLRTYQQEKLISIEIEDNGCGIPEQYLEKIFEPSFTLKGSKDKTGSYKPSIKGTGYGMSNVKKYVDQHKGTILIVSSVGKGTKTTINFPVIKKQLTEKEIAEVQQDAFHFNKYILLVEDEQAISEVQYRILTTAPCNHKVDIASSGKVAIDLLNRNKYDFVSLDYVLPGGINGMDVYHHIRESDNTIPILFISGNIEFLESIKELQQKDFNVDHLSKPCQNLDYIKSINKLMNS